MKQGGAATPNQINMVAVGTVFDGTLRAESDVRVSGRIIGTLKVAGRVVVASEGVIEGELLADNADIAGHVQGEMHVGERLVLRSSARIDGTIQTGRLIVEEGAVFNGECQMGQPGQLHKQADASRESVSKRAEVAPEARPRPGDVLRPDDVPRPSEGKRAGEGGDPNKAQAV